MRISISVPVTTCTYNSQVPGIHRCSLSPLTMTKLPGQINLHEKDDNITFYVAKKAHESLYIHVSLKMCSE